MNSRLSAPVAASPLARRFLIGAGVCSIAVLALLIIHASVAASLKASRAENYRLLLDAQVARLQQWIDERRADVEQLASDPAIIGLARELARQPDACAREAAHLAVAGDVLAFRFGHRAPPVLHMLDAAGHVLMSNRAGYCGVQLPEELRARLVLARQRGSAFVRPLDGDAQPLVWFEAPVGMAREQAIFVGIGVDASAAFRFLAESGRFGETGEIYVVDGERRALSALRDEPRPGPLPANPLLAGLQAARAAGGNETAGAVMEPYHGHDGSDRVGVWRWLPRRGIGLVLEVTAAEAYAPLRGLRLAAWWLGGLTLVVGGMGLALRLAARGAGERIGPYRLIGRLGEGAVSDVYLAEHVPMRRQVALKVLKPHAAGDEWSARFRREAQLAGNLRHPNFVRIFDYGAIPGGGFYCAMEYLQGHNFAELVEQAGAQPPARVAWLLAEVCDALAEAHAQGILHRDIKPQNLMLCAEGDAERVKVLDFGLVKQVEGDHSRDLTVGLRILGTPAYLAPERITDPAGADPRSDLYAVGAVGFFLLTGHRPFEPRDDLQLTHRILHEPAARVVALVPGVPPALDALIARCLDKSPAARPATAAALAAELRALAG